MSIPPTFRNFCASKGSVINKTLLASEQERVDARKARTEWRCWRQPAKTNMTSLRGQRLNDIKRDTPLKPGSRVRVISE